jgi:hypothetical protein
MQESTERIQQSLISAEEEETEKREREMVHRSSEIAFGGA